MKKLSLLIVLFCVTLVSMAQDVIVMTDNSTVLSKVLEITSTEIKYKKWSNQDGPTYSISRSEVISINYQNGEVETFSGNGNEQINTNQQPLQPLFKGAMQPSGLLGERLSINGYKLSDEQVRKLVDEQSYQLYQKAKRQFNAAMILSVIGSVGLAVGAGVFMGLKPGNPNYDQLSVIGGTGIGIAVCTLLPGVFIGMNLDHKTKKVAHEYNKKYGYYHALNISPSMMRYGNPQSANNYGLGLMVSMNF